MNLHFFDYISINSKDLLEFKSILKHTFYFDLDIAINRCKILQESPKNSNIIDDIFLECDNLCKPIFHKDSFYFFGFHNSKSNQFCTSISRNPDFWKTAIKYHCVISSLYTLLHYQLRKYEITSYRLINDIKHLGYFSLINKQILSINQDMSIKINRVKNGNEDYIDRSDKCANYSKTYRNFYENLDFKEQKTLGMSLKKNRITSLLLNTDIIYRLIELRSEGGINKKFHQFYQENNENFSCNDYFKVSQKLQNILNTRKDDDDIVDQILLQYKMERFYNCSLTYCIIKSLLDFSHKQDLLTLDSFPLEILELAYRLPNTFSRNDFFIYALYSFQNDYLSDSIFNNGRNNLSPFAKHTNPTPDRIRLITWLPLFQQFMLFFTTVVFPLYERCFFLLLQSTQKYKSVNSYVSNSINMLYNYLKNHAQYLYENKIDSLDLPENFRKLKISQIETDNKVELQTLDLLTKKILIKQNNIFHSVPYPHFNADFFGFSSSKQEGHCKLMLLLIDSILNNVK